MVQAEAKFKNHLRESFEAMYAGQHFFNFAVVANMMQKAGVPDDYFAVGGKTAWVEAKADGGGFTAAQKLVIPQMVAAGLRVVIVDAEMKEKEETLRRVFFTDFKQAVMRPKFLVFQWEDVSTYQFWEVVFGSRNYG